MKHVIRWTDDEVELVTEQVIEDVVKPGFVFVTSSAGLVRCINAAQKIILGKDRWRNFSNTTVMGQLGNKFERLCNHPGIQIKNVMPNSAGYTPLGPVKLNGAKKAAEVVAAPAVAPSSPQIEEWFVGIVARALEVVRSRELGGVKPEFVSAANNTGTGLIASTPSSKIFRRPRVPIVGATENQKKAVDSLDFIPKYCEGAGDLRKLLEAENNFSRIVVLAQGKGATKLLNSVKRLSDGRKVTQISNRPAALKEVVEEVIAARRAS